MFRLSVTLKIIERYARFFKSEKFKELNLSGRQAEILLTAYKNPDFSQDDIADRLLINKSVIARQLMAMEDAGLVKRNVSSKDRRVTLVSLTEQAEALIPQIREVNRKWEDFMTEGLSQEEYEVLNRALENIRTRIRAKLKQEG